jgi:hypothetical protein
MKNAAKIEAAASGAAEDLGWRQFPKFEEILSSPEPPTHLLGKIEKTCRQLNNIIQDGSDADQARARAAMAAYGRSLDLLRILTEARDKAGQA